ncbi:hypothetical protein A9Q84_04845 [Halobacteriovorax marinus]|uniref:Response regulatory domain-containing protein n=1 Tax=Halobacteriovorax marinus TaxID=97084 RepID=A0A1Y5FEW3_9BACT|nr:hypothetical protein A9Q84_04845 [Halobacteriovorax marinus]
MSLARKKICIVDDDHGIHDFLEDYISSVCKDTYITHAFNGHEGLTKIEVTKYDLLITDLNMPHMKGGNMLKHILRMKKEVVPSNILIFSGFVEPDKEGPGKIKNLTYMSKPFDSDRFNEYLNKSLNIKVLSKFENVTNVKLMNPFSEAIIKVASLSFFSEVEFKRVFVRENDEKISMSITCSSLLSNDDIKGSVNLGMPLDVYSSIVNKGKDIEILKLSDKNTHFLNEFFNQVLEYATRKLQTSGKDFTFSPSSIEYGEDVTFKHFFKGPNITVEFSHNGRPFYLEFVLMKTR